MSQEKIAKALSYRNVAVVGLSRDPSKESHMVASYLKRNGYRIIPVNPFTESILGEKCYKSLAEMPHELKESLEVVDVFRPSSDVPEVSRDVLKVKETHDRPLVVWMQLGIEHEGAEKELESAGIEVIMNRCMMVEHQRLKGAS